MRLFSGCRRRHPLPQNFIISVGEAFRLPFLCAVCVCFREEPAPPLPQNFIIFCRGGVSPPVFVRGMRLFSGCRRRHPLPQNFIIFRRGGAIFAKQIRHGAKRNLFRLPFLCARCSFVFGRSKPLPYRKILLFSVGEARFLRSKFAMERSGICSASRFCARYAFVFGRSQPLPYRKILLFSVGEAFRLPFLCAVCVCFREGKPLPYRFIWNVRRFVCFLRDARDVIPYRVSLPLHSVFLTLHSILTTPHICGTIITE